MKATNLSYALNLKVIAMVRQEFLQAKRRLEAMLVVLSPADFACDIVDFGAHLGYALEELQVVRNARLVPVEAYAFKRVKVAERACCRARHLGLHQK